MSNELEKSFKMGRRIVPVWKIPVNVLENDQDYEFVFVDAGDGKKQMAVF